MNSFIWIRFNLLKIQSTTTMPNSMPNLKQTTRTSSFKANTITSNWIAASALHSLVRKQLSHRPMALCSRLWTLRQHSNRFVKPIWAIELKRKSFVLSSSSYLSWNRTALLTSTLNVASPRPDTRISRQTYLYTVYVLNITFKKPKTLKIS